MLKIQVIILSFISITSIHTQTSLHLIKHPSRDFGKSIIETGDHQILIAGNSIGTNQEAFLYKLGSTGNVSWKKSIHSAYGVVKIFKIYECNDGNYVIAGEGSSQARSTLTTS